MKIQDMLTQAGIDPNLFTGEHWKLAGTDLVMVLEQAAIQFVLDNKAICLNLTASEIKGILFDAVIQIPDLPNVPEDASSEMLAAAARVILSREQAALLNSQAQKERNINTAQVEKNAKEFAIKLGNLVIAAGLGALTTAAKVAL
jgi:hypothetical protein